MLNCAKHPVLDELCENDLQIKRIIAAFNKIAGAADKAKKIATLFIHAPVKLKQAILNDAAFLESLCQRREPKLIEPICQDMGFRAKVLGARKFEETLLRNTTCVQPSFIILIKDILCGSELPDWGVTEKLKSFVAAQRHITPVITKLLAKLKEIKPHTNESEKVLNYLNELVKTAQKVETANPKEVVNAETYTQIHTLTTKPVALPTSSANGEEKQEVVVPASDMRKLV